MLRQITKLGNVLLDFLVLQKLFKIRGGYDFAFLVHSRNERDLHRFSPILRVVPTKVLRALAYWMWPFRVSDVTGLSDKNGKPLRGVIIGISLMPDQMLMGNSPIPLRKVKQACLLAKNLGCKRVGLGSFTSVVSKSGTLLTGNPELAGLHFTTGNTTTAYTTLSNISKHSGEAGMHTEETTIALLGATGSIGKAVSIYLAKLPYKECILIGRDNAKLESLKREIDGEAGGRVRKITTTSSLDSIREADVLVVMTSSASFLVDSRLLKSGSLVLDITQPSNISDLVVRERSDVTFIDIGLVQTPGVEIRYNLGIARGTAFACLAETMILASEHSEEDFVGHVDFRHIDRIEKLFGASQFKLTSIVRK